MKKRQNEFDKSKNLSKKLLKRLVMHGGIC